MIENQTPSFCSLILLYFLSFQHVIHRKAKSNTLHLRFIKDLAQVFYLLPAMTYQHTEIQCGMMLEAFLKHSFFRPLH